MTEVGTQAQGGLGASGPPGSPHQNAYDLDLGLNGLLDVHANPAYRHFPESRLLARPRP